MLIFGSYVDPIYLVLMTLFVVALFLIVILLKFLSIDHKLERIALYSEKTARNSDHFPAISRGDIQPTIGDPFKGRRWVLSASPDEPTAVALPAVDTDRLRHEEPR